MSRGLAVLRGMVRGHSVHRFQRCQRHEYALFSIGITAGYVKRAHSACVTRPVRTDAQVLHSAGTHSVQAAMIDVQVSIGPAVCLRQDCLLR